MESKSASKKSNDVFQMPDFMSPASMFDPKMVQKMMFESTRMFLKTSFEAMNIFQDQLEKSQKAVLGGKSESRSSVEKMVSELSNNTRKGIELWYNMVDDSIRIMEDTLT